MNFLSHYYFVRHSRDPYLILGMALPDLVKNHRKSWNLHPYRYAPDFGEAAALASIYRGWMLHLGVDRLFHNSAFFRRHSKNLRIEIAARIKRPPFRAFFLAHVGLELLLDSLLLRTERVSAQAFYRQLSGCRPEDILRFLEISKAPAPLSFLSWFRDFVENPYLDSYRETGSLSHSLDRIGQRVWKEALSADEKEELGILLQAYQGRLETEYLPIFDEISLYLQP